MGTRRPWIRWTIRLLLIVLIVAAGAFAFQSYRRQQPAYLAAQAHEALEAGDDEKAESSYGTCVRRAPDDADAKLALADLFVRREPNGPGVPPAMRPTAAQMQLLAEAAAHSPTATNTCKPS